MRYMTIGEFAERARLSAKALRLYDDLKLVVPARVDPVSGYRLYSEDQVGPARLVGQLRRLDMPLAVISGVLEMDGPTAAQALAEWWDEVEATMGQRRALVSYLHASLSGKGQMTYDIQVRSMPDRRLVYINRHVHGSGTDSFFDEAFSQLRGAGPGIEGVEGAPFLVFYGEVSEDSDGPIELCRPVGATAAVGGAGEVQERTELAHEEAFIRLRAKDLGWPEMLPAMDALQRWVSEHRRQPAGPLRQLLVADQRTASPETLVCDLSVPLR